MINDENSDQFRERRIFTVHGVLPEPGGYGVAKFSRSSQPYQQWIMDLTQEGAEKFYETFYFDYGHSSIADLAHITVIFENISMVAAEELWDEPLIDGQASSTRYQDFEKRGVHVPTEIAAGSLEAPYRQLCQSLLNAYRQFLPGMLGVLKERHAHERPPEMDDGKYERTLKARAFDIVRYVLPMGIRTGLGHLLSARTLERRLVALLSHPLIEVREIAQELKEAAVKKPAFNPMGERLAAVIKELRSALPDQSRHLADHIKEIAHLGAPSVPTLVKYAEQSASIMKTRERLRRLAAELAPKLAAPDTNRGVTLSDGLEPEIEQVATLLYTTLSHSYQQIEAFVRDRMTSAERAELLEEIDQFRGKYDPPPFQTRSGYRLIFDLCLDCGAWRDFHRHRRLIQIHKPFDASLGFDTPAEFAGSKLQAGYESLMCEAGKLASIIDSQHDGVGQYALPFAFRRRSLFKMDAEELQYIAELRTGPENHFSVREIAHQMYERYAERHPRLARMFRVAHPSVQEFFQR